MLNATSTDLTLLLLHAYTTTPSSNRGLTAAYISLLWCNTGGELTPGHKPTRHGSQATTPVSQNKDTHFKKCPRRTSLGTRAHTHTPSWHGWSGYRFCQTRRTTARFVHHSHQQQLNESVVHYTSCVLSRTSDHERSPLWYSVAKTETTWSAQTWRTNAKPQHYATTTPHHEPSFHITKHHATSPMTTPHHTTPHHTTPWEVGIARHAKQASNHLPRNDLLQLYLLPSSQAGQVNSHRLHHLA